MTTGRFRLENKVCRECNQDYEAKIGIKGLVNGFDFSRGYCDTCWQEKIREEDAREKVVRQLEIDQKRRGWREGCGIPPKFMTEEFGTFEQERQQKAYDKCLDYASNYPLGNSRNYPSLVLFSDHSWGTGKSHLAYSIAHHILNRWSGEEIPCPVCCISEYDIFARIQETFNYSPEEKFYRESEADIIRHLIAVDLLIIDDIGKEKRSDPKFVQRTLFKIIDGRWKGLRPMVVTANLSPKKLAIYLGAGSGEEASYDRLWEMCEGEAFEMEGESYRRVKITGKG